MPWRRSNPAFCFPKISQSSSHSVPGWYEILTGTWATDKFFSVLLFFYWTWWISFLCWLSSEQFSMFICPVKCRIILDVRSQYDKMSLFTYHAGVKTFFLHNGKSEIRCTVSPWVMTGATYAVSRLQTRWLLNLLLSSVIFFFFYFLPFHYGFKAQDRIFWW